MSIRHEFACRGCGRPEGVCSADPCVDVMRDRADTCRSITGRFDAADEALKRAGWSRGLDSDWMLVVAWLRADCDLGSAYGLSDEDVDTLSDLDNHLPDLSLNARRRLSYSHKYPE